MEFDKIFGKQATHDYVSAKLSKEYVGNFLDFLTILTFNLLAEESEDPISFKQNVVETWENQMVEREQKSLNDIENTYGKDVFDLLNSFSGVDEGVKQESLNKALEAIELMLALKEKK